MIETDNSIWPSFFMYVPDSKAMYMYRPLKNSGLDQAALKAAVAAFLANIEGTSAIWSMSNFNEEPAPAAPAAK
jgi:hypothetical protein